MRYSKAVNFQLNKSENCDVKTLCRNTHCTSEYTTMIISYILYDYGYNSRKILYINS